jgi:hypothetical protein
MYEHLTLVSIAEAQRNQIPQSAKKMEQESLMYKNEVKEIEQKKIMESLSSLLKINILKTNVSKRKKAC